MAQGHYLFYGLVPLPYPHGARQLIPDLDKFIIRLSPGLRDRIASLAKQNGRSMNSEILNVLNQTFPDGPSIDELISKIDHIKWISSDSISPRKAKILGEILDSLSKALENADYREFGDDDKIFRR